MRIGMLWFDNNPNTDLATKVNLAAAYYAKKYGSSPNLVFIHPSMNGNTAKVGEIEIRTNRSVLPNHFWVGVNSTPD